METFKPKHGDFIVLRINEKSPEKTLIGYQAVYLINDNFPIPHLNAIMENGYYDIREADELEKEFCYNCLDTKTDCSIDLAYMEKWQEGGRNG